MMPGTLEISCDGKNENEEHTEGYWVRERVYGFMRRLVMMPTEVTDDANASFKTVFLKSGSGRPEFPQNRV